MPAQRQIVVAEVGARQTTKGPIRFIKDLDGTEYSTWSESVIPGALPHGAVVSIVFETTRKPRQDGGFFENNKLIYVEAGPQAAMAPALPAQDGEFSSPPVQAQIQSARDRDEKIVRQTAGKAASMLIGNLYSGAGTYNHEHQLALRHCAAMLYAWFMTGEWSDTMQDVLPGMDEDDGIPFEREEDMQ